jgi:hypothetical protein
LKSSQRTAAQVHVAGNGPPRACCPVCPACAHPHTPRTHTRHARTCVAVEGAVWGGVAHECQDGLAHGQQRPRGAPRGLQDVQADLARLPCRMVRAQSGAVRRA